MKPGERFAERYEVVAILGRGGMGTVYEVIDLHLQRSRALKVLHGHVAAQAALRERFVLEARLGGRVDSPHLVDVVDAGFDDAHGQLFLVMERLQGETLAARLARAGSRPADEVVDHLGQVALALDRMHACGVVHRDLKPANLFLHAPADAPPRIKLLDLGIAKVMSDTGGDSTSVVGTPAYMAPEQLRGRGVGPATDRYALAMIAFTLLVGHHYWREAGELDPIGFGLIAVRGAVTPATMRARELDVELPPAFDRWFARAVAVRPERRFESASAAVHALADALAVVAPPWLAPSPPGPRPPPVESFEDAHGPVTALAATVGSSAPAAGVRTEASSAAPDRGRPRRRWMRVGGLVGAGLIALAGSAFGSWSLSAGGGADRPWTPLAGEGGALACPILEVDDPDRRGWLGAAAASLACERARVVLGGRPDRTVLPAELRHLPSAPADEFTVEPFAGAAARASSLAEARKAAAYLDGRVATTAGGFRVELALRWPDGGVIAHHRGEGVALIDAVRDAMAPMIIGYALPWADHADPIVADHAGVADLATQLDLLDLTLAFAINAGQLGDECATFARRHPAAGPRLGFAGFECAYTQGLREPAVALPATAATDGELALHARVRHMVERSDDDGERARLTVMFERSTSGWARSMLATTLSCLWDNHDADIAASWSHRAVEAEPKNPDGAWCAPWEQLLAVSYDHPGRRHAVATAMQGWRPWHPYGWWTAEDPTGAFTERAYLLAPYNTVVAAAWVARLIAAKRPLDARRVIERLADGPAPVHRLESQRLAAELDAADSRFDVALAQARRAMRPGPDDAGWVRAQRLAAAAFAVRLAEVTGDGAIAREAATQLLAANPALMAPVDLAGLYRIAMICGHAPAPVAARCFAAMPPVQPGTEATSVTRVSAFIAGAEAYARGALAEAAQAWRPQVASDDLAVALMAAAMVDAFVAADEPAFIALVVDRAPRWNGASMAMARAALAAAGRGAGADARSGARAVIAAWGLASSPVPILADLRPLAR